MTTEIQTSFVDPQVSAMMQLTDRLTPFKNALGLTDFSVPELQLFAMVATSTGLDPFTRQIYAVKRNGKVVYQTGIDGYRSVAESKGGGQYAGSDEAAYETCDCGAEPKDHPAVARVVVNRILPGGHVVKQTGVARWHELYPGAGEDGFMWRKMPFNQLAKCAEANGLRKAFPRVLNGIYIEEEMEQAGPGANPALVDASTRETARDRLAARRAAIEAPVVIDAVAATDAPVEADRPAPAAPEPRGGLCLVVSPYGDGAACGLPADHLTDPKAAKLHRAVSAEGEITGSWPV